MNGTAEGVKLIPKQGMSVGSRGKERRETIAVGRDLNLKLREGSNERKNGGDDDDLRKVRESLDRERSDAKFL